MALLRTLLASAALLALAACSPSDAPGASGKTAASNTTGDASSKKAASSGLSLQAINGAQFTPPAGGSDSAGNETGEDNEINGYDNVDGNATGTPDADATPPSPTLVRAEVLLDRAAFSPGVIDGRMGENVKHAIMAYDAAHGLQPSDTLDEATWTSLTSADNAPVLKTYTLTQADAAGPFSPDVGEDFVKMSKVQSLGYTSPLQMLSQRFHMDEHFLQALNPGADLTKAGTQIVVVDPGQGALPEVKSLDVNKKMAQVTAYDDSHKVVAVFPATVGSMTRPSPKGTWKVTGVSQNPDYMYDPAKLTWGPKHAGKLHIPPGPNNPVGVVWIALSAPDYGIHGSPDPHVIGKTASHGCVRLTNWDAEELSKAVKPGVKVTFVSQRG